MIRYEKCGLDDDSIRLLKKLEPNFPFRSLAIDIENKNIDPVKVFYDEKLYGLVVLRGILNRRGTPVLVVDHAIAEDGIETSFGNILAESIQETAKKNGFLKVRQHANNAGLARMLRRYYGAPVEEVFEIDVDTPHNLRKAAHEHKQNI